MQSLITLMRDDLAKLLPPTVLMSLRRSLNKQLSIDTIGVIAEPFVKEIRSQMTQIYLTDCN